MPDRLKQRCDEHGFENVELELSPSAGHSHSCVISKHLRTACQPSHPETTLRTAPHAQFACAVGDIAQVHIAGSILGSGHLSCY